MSDFLTRLLTRGAAPVGSRTVLQPEPIVPLEDLEATEADEAQELEADVSTAPDGSAPRPPLREAARLEPAKPPRAYGFPAPRVSESPGQAPPPDRPVLASEPSQARPAPSEPEGRVDAAKPAPAPAPGPERTRRADRRARAAEPALVPVTIEVPVEVPAEGEPPAPHAAEPPAFVEVPAREVVRAVEETAPSGPPIRVQPAREPASPPSPAGLEPRTREAALARPELPAWPLEPVSPSPAAAAPKVEVRIGRLEIRSPAPPPSPAPAPARREPRGFAEHTLSRRFLDRGWS